MWFDQTTDAVIPDTFLEKLSNSLKTVGENRLIRRADSISSLTIRFTSSQTILTSDVYLLLTSPSLINVFTLLQLLYSGLTAVTKWISERFRILFQTESRFFQLMWVIVPLDHMLGQKSCSRLAANCSWDNQGTMKKINQIFCYRSSFALHHTQWLFSVSSL